MKSKTGSIGIIGLGKFGMYLANELIKANREIICVDKDDLKVQKALDFCQYAFVSEDLSTKTLQELGFKECDIIVVCIGEHMDTAIFATLNALNLGVRKVIAMSNTEEQGVVLEKLGAEVIYPYKDSSDKLAKKILTNDVMEFISLNDEIEITEVKIPKSLINKTVLESNIRQKFFLNIIAIEQKDKIITNINPHYVLQEDDKLVVIGQKKDVRKFEIKR